jgi:hypothetical protein
VANEAHKNQWGTVTPIKMLRRDLSFRFPSRPKLQGNADVKLDDVTPVSVCQESKRSRNVCLPKEKRIEEFLE